jgi:hypothetical protein
MKIRKLHLNKELIYLEEGGENIKCPVCEATWFENEEHVESPCSHLRFCYCTHDPDFVFFLGDWDHFSFVSSFQDLGIIEDGFDELKAFQEIEHPEIDGIVYWDYDDFPLVQWSTYWGYKKE